MSTAIGGGGRTPSRIAFRWSRPDRSRRCSAAATGSSQVIVRERVAGGFVTKPTVSDPRAQAAPQLRAPAVAQDAHGSVVAGGAHDAAARMRPGTAEVQAVHRGR